jgi:hypothetical protein
MLFLSRFFGSCGCGLAYSCSSLYVRAHEEVPFKIVNSRDTLNMTSLLLIVNITLTDPQLRLRDEIIVLSDESFGITSTHIFAIRQVFQTFPLGGSLKYSTVLKAR